MKKAFSCLIIIILIVIFSSNCLFAASDKKNIKNKSGALLSSSKIQTYKKRLAKLLSPVKYHYIAAGKPDPFRPFFRNKIAKVKKKKKTTIKKPDKCNTPLECMDVGQLTLVGIVIDKKGDAIAMAQDASGIGYILKKGTRIGYRSGKVIKIERGRVVVREQVEDLRGELTFRDRVLYLHPEEENGTR